MVEAKKSWKFAGGYAFISKSGKRGWSKTKPTSTNSRIKSKTQTQSKRKGVKRMARKRRSYIKRRARPKKDKRIPILPLAGIAVSVAKPIEKAIAGDYEGALAELSARFTGYNPQSQVFDWKYALLNGYVPVIAGALGSKLATKVGANRAISKVPMIGKYIKL